MDFFTNADLNVGQYYKQSYGSVEDLITQAKNGNITAQGDLGMAYAEGVEDFVAKDSEKAIGWLNTAVENGYVLPFIVEKLGELYDLKGTPQYQRKAYEMYHRAAKLGSADAQLNLAEMYRCGVKGVVNEDIKEAFEWYKKASDESAADDSTEVGAVGRLVAGTFKKMGNVLGGARQKALTFLYKYYLEGECPEGRPQPTKAVYYLTRAAELGETVAQLKLGQIYLTGSCEQIKDVRKARRWLEKASAGGDVNAKQLLQQCKQNDDAQHDASEVSEEAFTQSFAIMGEKLKQRTKAKVHPFAISQPVAFSEEILSQFNWSPTARYYLQAYKLVKEGLEILYKKATEEAAAEAFENSLKCCPSYFESKRGLGYSLMELYASKYCSERKDSSQDEPTELFRAKKPKACDKEISKYASWTAEELRGSAVKILKEFLVEAPSCYKTYPNVCYYLAKLAEDMQEFKEFYELGQDAEEKRLPFFGPFNHPLKDLMTPRYQLFANLRKTVGCGNSACVKKLKESDLKSCGGCKKQKYCSKDCQKADWKNHKAACTSFKGPKTKNGRT
ncbi:hypothetical protein ACROYT_G034563 [Oculina patagonica]